MTILLRVLGFLGLLALSVLWSVCQYEMQFWVK